MRWALWITTTLGIALGVYIASPLIALHGIASAVEARDAAALSERLEFPALRRSLTKQIVAEYLKLTGKKLPIQAMARTLVGSCRSHRRPLDDRPCHFGFAWQGRCWRKGEAPDRSCSLHGVFIPKPLASLVGIRLSRKREEQFRVHIRWHWRVVALELPEDLKERLARELIKLTQDPI